MISDNDEPRSPDPQECEIFNLAALGLAMISRGPELMLTRHRPTPTGTCAECGEPWRCRLSRIAIRAYEVREEVSGPAQSGRPRNPTPSPGPFESELPLDAVPPVLGLGEEWGHGQSS
jgi:hypothetical protein